MLTLQRASPPLRRRLLGLAAIVVGIGSAVLVLLPVRSSLDVDAVALVLVVPVALGVAIGGFPVAPIGVLLGFLAYDFFFIPPYGTFEVSQPSHLVGMGVYAVVSMIVGAVVAQAQHARAVAQERELESRVLLQLAEAVSGTDGLGAALDQVVRLACQLFDLAGAVVILLGDDGVAVVAATAGGSIPERDLQRFANAGSSDPPAELTGVRGLFASPLRIEGGPSGFLVGEGGALEGERERLLKVFAAQAGVAVERARLVEETSRSRALGEVDRLRSALMGAVTHDLRTPLASIKASVSDLADPAVHLGLDDRVTLLATIDQETDRLTKLVENALEMSRIEADALELNRVATPLDELTAAVVRRLATTLARHEVSVDMVGSLPLVDIDYVLVEHTLANLLENASRYCEDGTPIEIHAAAVSASVEVRVVDHGPGIPVDHRAQIFERYFRLDGNDPRRGSGLGLAICHGIVTAHNGDIWVEDTPGGGATFVFRLPISAAELSRADLEHELQEG